MKKLKLFSNAALFFTVLAFTACSPHQKDNDSNSAMASGSDTMGSNIAKRDTAMLTSDTLTNQGGVNGGAINNNKDITR